MPKFNVVDAFEDVQRAANIVQLPQSFPGLVLPGIAGELADNGGTKAEWLAQRPDAAGKRAPEMAGRPQWIRADAGDVPLRCDFAGWTDANGRGWSDAANDQCIFGAEMSPPNGAAVRFTNITKSFPGYVAVQGINLDVQSGRFLFVVGPSGCGLLIIKDNKV